MARRRYQRGQLFLRGSRNKVWIGRWRVDVIESGQLKRVHKSEILGSLDDLPTRKLALRALEDKLRQINSPSTKPIQKITFNEVASKWKATVAPNYKPSTQASIKAVLPHLSSYFGMSSLVDITPEHIQSFVQFSKAAHPKTIRHRLGIFRMLWNSARAWGYVTHDPFTGVVLPRLLPGTRRGFTPEQIHQILAAAPEPDRTFYWIAAETGMRGGEISGLRWEDIDGVNRFVQVRQSVWRGRAGLPKSAAGVRSFAVSRQLADHLNSVPRTADVSYVFHTSTGRPWDTRYISRRLHRLLDRLGIPRAGLHAFRHANASLLVSNGVSMKVAQSRLGHSNAAITLEVYSHLVGDEDHRTAEMISGILCPTCAQVEEPQVYIPVAQEVADSVCA